MQTVNPKSKKTSSYFNHFLYHARFSYRTALYRFREGGNSMQPLSLGEDGVRHDSTPDDAGGFLSYAGGFLPYAGWFLSYASEISPLP